MTIPGRSIIYRIFLLLALVFSTFLVQVQPAAAAPGIDGDQTISLSGAVVNRYAPVTAVAGNVVSVTDIDLLDDTADDHYANHDLSAGDMILIYQAQGAAFDDVTDTATYGAFTYEEAGTYEFASVVSVSGNDITVDATNTAPYSCGGITGTYDITDGNVQAVRVPQYSNLTINGGASIVAADWDGSTGGVVSVVVQSTLTVNGSIDVSGQGFRGGAVDNTSTAPPTGVTTFRSTSTADGVEKGESILGFTTEYNDANGQFGRGAPANGGGGGNAHNAGGGGGANGNNGGTWTGQGLPDTSNSSWDPAWDIDDGTNGGGGDPLPDYFVGGAGGGRGGYSYADTNQDPTLIEPGNGAWGGDDHRNVGGYGGRPLNNNPADQLFLGGGGGAGDANDTQGNSGGAGGGLVVIATFTLGGTGQILANGNSVPDTNGPNYADGNSGGGAGGTVVIGSSSVSGVIISAEGGAGGNVDDPLDINPGCSVGGTSVCTVGPGGGGGGGYVHVNAGSGSLTTSVNGGVNGIDTSTFVSEFPPDGTTAGYAGASSTTDFSFPGCSAPTAINLFGISTNSATPGTAVLPVLLLVIVITAAFLVWRRKSPSTA
jgi:hypothetical protein